MKAHHSKVIHGPGGIKCRCCNLGSVKESRVRLNRITRRIAKISLKDLLDGGE